MLKVLELETESPTQRPFDGLWKLKFIEESIENVDLLSVYLKLLKEIPLESVLSTLYELIGFVL